MKGQTRKWSIVEAIAGTAIGFNVALVTQILVFPWFGLHVAIHDNLIIGGIFTGVSLVRSYFVRRFFNWIDPERRRTRRLIKEAAKIQDSMDRIGAAINAQTEKS